MWLARPIMLEACQKRCEELVAILWIYLKIDGSCRMGQKELLLNTASRGKEGSSLGGESPNRPELLPHT